MALFSPIGLCGVGLLVCFFFFVSSFILPRFPFPSPAQAQFTHQIWIRSATYAYLTSLFPPDDALQPLLHRAHDGYTADALAGQEADTGVWREKGAFDAHYQGVSTLYAARSAAVTADAADRNRIIAALTAGLPPLLGAIGPDGGMSVVGSARVANEQSRDGKPKTLDVKGTATALLYARALIGDGEDDAGDGAGGKGEVGPWPAPPGTRAAAGLAPAVMSAAARKYGAAHTASFRVAVREAVRSRQRWVPCATAG